MNYFTATPDAERIPRRIIFPYAGDRFGGSNVSSLILAKTLQQVGHFVLVVAHGDGRAADEARRMGLPVEVLPPLSGRSGYSRSDRARLDQIGAFRAASRALSRLYPDIVHVNDLGMLRTWALPTLLTRTCMVAHWRTALPPSYSVAFALRCASAVVAISKRSRSALPEWAKHKTAVEYNPIANFVRTADRPSIKSDIRAQLSLPAQAVLLGVFGTLIRRKRCHVLADILHSISQTPDGRPVMGVVCGEPAEPLDNLLFKKIEAFGLRDRLKLVGFVRPAENWMAACDLVLAPAVDEAFGRTPLEAFASGTPALVSSDSGAVELLRHDEKTIVLPPEPIQLWIDTVAALLADKDQMQGIAERGAAAVAELSPRRHAERVEAIYDQVLHRARRAECAVQAYDMT